MKKISFLVCAAAMTTVAVADEIKTNDGSVFVGKIAEIDGGNVKIESNSAGTLTLKQVDVASMSSTEAVTVRLKDGHDLTGTLANGANSGEVLVGGVVVPMSEIAGSWVGDENSPEAKAAAKKEYKTTLEIGAGITGQTGNSETVNGNAYIESITANDINTLKLYAKYAYGKTKDSETGDWTKSSDNLHAGFDFKSDFYDPFFWYARTDLGFDRANNVKFFDTSAAGFGWNIIKEDNWKLAVRGGLSYRYENYRDYMNTWEDGESHDSTNSFGMDFGLSHEYDWSHSKIVTEITYTPAFDDFTGNYLITHETYYQHELSENPFAYFRIGVKNEYRSLNVNPDHLDTYYYATLVFNWK